MTLETMKLNITEDHIKNGKPEESEYCPIALAVKEQFQNTSSIWVSSNFIYLRVCNECKTYKLPANAQLFIRNFDSNLSVEPITIELTEYNK